jgi:hypothetical protein
VSEEFAGAKPDPPEEGDDKKPKKERPKNKKVAIILRE